MTFSSDLAAFSVKVETRNQAVFVNTVAQVKESIVNGSPITGAPGQPVDTGNLRASWQAEFDSPTSALVATNVEYAPYVEENVRGVTFHNHGPHSVALTRVGMQRIVDHETAAIVGGPK